ncbi:MAG: type II secretion system F family protein [Candidatus Omnitrophica bacterium]|nr:type II secretion system F family protein [Candidatus Omnitrophota bacterium]
MSQNILKILEEKKVGRGEDFSATVRDAGYLFPSMVAELIALGEETGRMDNALDLIANLHKKSLETYVKRLSSLIEPALIIFLGGLVGFVAWSLVAGILSVYGVYR